MSVPEVRVGKLAVHGIAWSIVQNWGGRVLTFLLFVFLARLLTPEEFGMVSAAMIVLLLISQVAEFGFGDAIVQRRDYVPADANLPFFVSVAGSVVLAVLCALGAARIEQWLDAPGLRPIIFALCLVAPLTTISAFQERQYTRNFAFRRLAFRVLVANLIAGVVAVGCAIAGFGIWSLVVQTYLVAIVGLIWLWSRPVWLPTLEMRPRAFAELTRFGLPIMVMRLLDFAATRFFEVVMIGHYGIATYGLYVAGSRLYQTLTQLLQTALNNVALSILSRISHDTWRMAQIYQQAISIAALIFAPIFVGCAALIPEISSILFGARWSGMDDVARPLLLLGAMQSIQFINGPYLASRGRPGLVLFISAIRNITVIFVVMFVKHDSIVEFVKYFVIAQLAGAPISFVITAKELSVPLTRLALCILPATLACAVAFFAVEAARPLIAAEYLHGPFAVGAALGGIFALCFAAIALTIGYSQVKMVRSFIVNRLSAR